MQYLIVRFTSVFNKLSLVETFRFVVLRSIAIRVSVCLYVCMYVRLFVYPLAHLNIYCSHGSILLRRQRNMLCTSGFVDDVMFSHNGPYGVRAAR